MTTAKRGRGRRRLRRLGRAVLVSLALLVVLHSIALVVLGRRLESRIATLKAAGKPVALSDLNASGIPESENGAAIYLRAIGEVSTPSVGPDEQVLSSYVAFRERQQDPRIWPEARRAAEHYRGVFELVAAAADRPRCRYPVDWSAGFEVKLTHLAGLRRVVRLMQASAILDARDGNTGRATDALALGFAASESLKDEPGLIAQLTRFAIIRMTSLSLREVMLWGDLDADRAARLERALASIDLAPGCVCVLEAERAIGLSTFDAFRRQGADAVWRLVRTDAEDAPVPLHWRLMGSYAGRPLLYLNELRYLDRMAEQIRDVHLPWSRLRGDFRRGRPAPSIWTGMATLLEIDASSTARQRDIAQAEVDGSRVLLALLRHRRELGSYPATLADLERALHLELPLDAFAGHTFRYRRQGSGFLLYSVGPDLRDDGGRPARWLESRPGAGIGEAALRRVPAGATARPAVPAGAETGAAAAASGTGRQVDPDEGDQIWRRER